MNILKKVEDFSKSISGKIFANYSLKKSSWFGLGGSADIFFKPKIFFSRKICFFHFFKPKTCIF